MDFLEIFQEQDTPQQYCREKIVSEDTYSFITDFPLTGIPGMGEAFCSADVDGLYKILYIDQQTLTSLELESYGYQSIPKLYGLMQGGSEGSGFGSGASIPGGFRNFNPDALIASGITQAQGAPLSLTGRGCVICFIDTGERVIIMSS